MYEYMNINILKSFFTLESLNILRCYISFNSIIHKPKLTSPEIIEPKIIEPKIIEP